MNTLNPNKRKIGFFMDEEVLRLVDEYANMNGISRGGAISVLCMDSLQQKTMIKKIPEMIEKINEEKRE